MPFLLHSTDSGLLCKRDSKICKPHAQVPIPQWLVTFHANDMRMSWIPPLVWSTVVKHAAVPLAKFAGFRAFEDEYPVVQA
jgi:hypothetical protein